MKEWNKTKRTFLGLLIIILSIGLGYGVFLITKPYVNGQNKTKSAMMVQKEEGGKEANQIIAEKENGKSNQDTNQNVNTSSSKDSNINANEEQLNSNGLYDSENMGKNSNIQVADSEEETISQDKVPTKVKGIYVTGPRAGSSTYMKELIDLVEATELNAMVIDIKNDSGEITYNMDLPIVEEISATQNYIRDMEELIKTLKEKDIYLIARIVAFKDPILAKNKPELSVKNQDGSIFHDKAGHPWVNPYKKEVWDYLMDISKKAIDLGFDEIQFDYIRFSTDKRIKDVDFGEEAVNKSKIDIITEFTKYANETLKPLGAYVSADVYGAIIDSEIDAKIVGQSYVEMSKHLDYICPMVYPSHYADGSYGIKYPDLEPYNLILKSMEASQIVLNVIPEGEPKAIVRPWLQDFTAKWLGNYKTYGGQEIKDQIKAVYDAGYEEWILWNGSNNYTKTGLELVK